MTTEAYIKEFFKKNPNEVRKLHIQRACMKSKAFAVAEMVDALHFELQEMGSKAKMSYRQAARLARCIDLENEKYGWDRTVKEMAHFLVNNR